MSLDPYDFRAPKKNLRNTISRLQNNSRFQIPGYSDRAHNASSSPDGRAVVRCSMTGRRCVSSVEHSALVHSPDDLRTGLTGRAQLFRMPAHGPAKGEGCLRGSWPNIHDLHAGGATHGRGMKRLPCPRPTTKRHAGTQDAAFLFELPVAAERQMPNPRRAILRPQPSIKEGTASRTRSAVRMRRRA